jgi:hypothetical protein
MGDEEQNDHDHGHRDNGDRDFRPHRNPYNGPPRGRGYMRGPR